MFGLIVVKVDPKTGMLINITDLKQFMKEAIMDKLDHKHLDEDVPELKGTITTTENVAIFIWHSMLRTKLPKNLLFEVRIHETENNVVVYRGEQLFIVICRND
jgi:6-pyruvoyltetrahydropterin/6-carboxytetrahydropterin synthase